MNITSVTQLRGLYDLPNERAKGKQLLSLDRHGENFIDKSPFLVISTVDKNGGMDISPRGGKIGFVKVLNNQTLIIPDAKGNNRIDSLINIVESGRIGMLFLIPGIDETFRVNGRAHISTDETYLNMFPSGKNLPKTCIVISIEEVFLHCAKALMRSKLWEQESQIERTSFPTMGQMLRDQLGSEQEAESQEEMIKRYQNDL